MWVTRLSAQSFVTPNQYGLSETRTDQERFWVLYKTHSEAVKKNCKVVYRDIDTLTIEIPDDGKTIPLSDVTDFGNTVFVVKNLSKDFTLFSMQNALEKYNAEINQIEERKRVIDTQKFILVIEDTVPWVRNRKGYTYGHQRRDIVYVDGGRVYGSVVSSYMTKETHPQFSRAFVKKNAKVFKNLTIIRDSISTYKTFVLRIDNQYNVTIKNISIKTPPNKLYGDAALRVENSYKVRLQSIIIDGTYSQVDNYGYGICMNNVSDIEINRLKADANWGVFGNNNINNVRLKNCDINRFDIHCYGKDVSFENCVFRRLYNQFSSIYGKVIFKKCEFIDFFPVLFESSYNAYTLFDLYFNKCVVYASPKRDCLIYGGNLDGGRTNGRLELSQQAFPNLYIKGLTVYLPKDSNIFYIYRLSSGHLRWPKDSIPGVKVIKDFRYRE